MAERQVRPISAEETEEQRAYMRRVAEMQQRPQSYFIVTYGCQMNAHDSEQLAGMLRQMGLEEALDRTQADFVIFNTCCVRDNAERRALGNIAWLRQLRRDRPWMKIGVCGCMVQEPGMAQKLLKQYGFVSLAFGTANLYRFPELFWRMLQQDEPVLELDERNTLAEQLPTQRLRREAAYVNIMYGCDNFCSFCIVPYVRGRERSRLPGDILAEVRRLAEEGVQEIMLLGQNVNSYGKGLEQPVSFAGLLRQLDDAGIPRIRFMTSHPKDLSDELIETMGSARHVLPQFHLPVQSGNDEVLRRMNRHYDRETYLRKVEALRQAVPGIGLTTDIIVGFPGETEEQFQDTLSLVEQVGYDSAFTFVYSPRVGTVAAKMPDQVPAEVSKDRIQRLIALQEDCQRRAMQRFVGTEEQVLVEALSRRSDQAVSGRGTHGLSVTLPGSAADVGHILRVKISGVKNNTLSAQRL